VFRLFTIYEQWQLGERREDRRIPKIISKYNPASKTDSDRPKKRWKDKFSVSLECKNHILE
jgi:hypothetical protein